MIKVNDRFYICADSNCYTLKEKVIVQDETSKRYGEEEFNVVGYYSTLESCLKGILTVNTRGFIAKDEINTIKDLKDYVTKLREYIESLNLNI